MELILGLVLLVLDILAIISVLQSSASTLSKALWILGIVIFPLVGLIVWYFVGPKGGRTAMA